jgi:hypothetical protein
MLNYQSGYILRILGPRIHALNFSDGIASKVVPIYQFIGEWRISGK